MGNRLTGLNEPIANLYGPTNNLLVMMDVNTCADTWIVEADNQQYCTNVANWLAGEAVVPVPEPMSLLLLGTGLFGIGAAATRRRWMSPGSRWPRESADPAIAPRYPEALRSHLGSLVRRARWDFSSGNLCRA